MRKRPGQARAIDARRASTAQLHWGCVSDLRRAAQRAGVCTFRRLAGLVEVPRKAKARQCVNTAGSLGRSGPIEREDSPGDRCGILPANGQPGKSPPPSTPQASVNVGPQGLSAPDRPGAADRAGTPEIGP